MMAECPASKEVANIKLRRLLAYNESLGGADARVGYSARRYKTSNRGSTLRRRGPAKILDIDDAGVTVEFRKRAIWAARFRSRTTVDAQDVGEVAWNPAPAWPNTQGGMLSVELGGTQIDGRFPP